MSLVIISSSLNPESNSRKLAEFAASNAKENAIDVELLDLRNFPLDLCDGGASFENENIGKLFEKIEGASAVILAGPIYTYGMGSAAKNLIESTGKAWVDKPVGLMAAAGGKNSYMAVLGIANSLMLDYRCPIIPRYVYTDGDGFDDAGNVSESIQERIAELVKTTAHWGDVL